MNPSAWPNGSTRDPQESEGGQKMATMVAYDAGMSDIKKESLDLADFAYQRLATRLEGMTDEEYFWEPAPDCWTIRRNGDGTFRGDGGLIFEATPPVTTIAWRLSHIVDCLTADRCATLVGLEPKAGAHVQVLQAATADDAIAEL